MPARPIRTKRIYEPAAASDGLRLLVMRFWPRGVKRSAVDAWEPELGSTPDLISDWRGGKISWPEFRRRYLAAMKPQGERIRSWAQRARLETITLLCTCEDDSRCHRSILKELMTRPGPLTRPVRRKAAR